MVDFGNGNGPEDPGPPNGSLVVTLSKTGLVKTRTLNQLYEDAQKMPPCLTKAFLTDVILNLPPVFSRGRLTAAFNPDDNFGTAFIEQWLGDHADKVQETQRLADEQKEAHTDSRDPSFLPPSVRASEERLKMGRRNFMGMAAVGAAGTVASPFIDKISEGTRTYHPAEAGMAVYDGGVAYMLKQQQLAEHFNRLEWRLGTTWRRLQHQPPLPPSPERGL